MPSSAERTRGAVDAAFAAARDSTSSTGGAPGGYVSALSNEVLDPVSSDLAGNRVE